MKTIIPSRAALLLAFPALVVDAAIQQGERAGCFFGPAKKAPDEFNGEGTR